MSDAMPSLADLEVLRDRVVADLADAPSVKAVDELAATALGPASPVAEARRNLRDADPSERGALGKAISEVATAIETATRNRWVVLRGHYAREREYRACHYEFPADWYGEANPVAGKMNDADARADCAAAFVAESVGDGTPN